MTREQMISTLRGMDFGSTIGSKGDEALRMAIAELEQEPCDTISREAVKKWICKTCPDDSECQRDCDVIKGIDALPSVQPKPIECEDAISRRKAISVISACDGKSAQIEALEQLPSVQPSRKGQTVCDLCRFNPPSSTDGKPCTMCPAETIDMRGDTNADSN